MIDPLLVTLITAALDGVEMLNLKRDRVSEPLLMGMNVPLVYCRLNIAVLDVSCDWMQIRPVSVERASVSLVCKPELSKSLSVDEEE